MRVEKMRLEEMRGGLENEMKQAIAEGRRDAARLGHNPNARELQHCTSLHHNAVARSCLASCEKVAHRTSATAHLPSTFRKGRGGRGRQWPVEASEGSRPGESAVRTHLLHVR